MRAAVVVALLAAPVGVAEAHIHLLQPMARQTDAQGDPQKEGHCGLVTSTRTTNRVNTYLPGATITVTWAETINHPGHFRIAFQPEGQTFTLPPMGPTAGSFPTVDETGMTDMTTGTMILKDMIPDGTLSTEITFPTMECANCTLQFIQVMTNSPPYQPALTAQNDLYFNCADIVLAANAPDAGTQVNDPDAGVDDPGGPKSGSESGGCSAGGSGAGLPAAFALLGFVGFRRRRRSA
jgi:uncharacterized protein (TIGR03382 family)